MYKCVRLTVLAVFVVFASGCATIISGTTQKVNVTSDPSGAMAKVDGTTAAITPTVFTLERKVDHTMEISKEGYRVATVILRHTVNGATAGNIVAGGVIGLGIDAMTGAMYKLVPDRVDVKLEKAYPGEVESAKKEVTAENEANQQLSLQEKAGAEQIAKQEQSAAPGSTAANFGPKK